MHILALAAQKPYEYKRNIINCQKRLCENGMKYVCVCVDYKNSVYMAMENI